MKTHRFLSILLLVCSSSASFSQAQRELPPLTERVDVRIVNVDVTVTGENAQLVTGLTSADFEVLEDGKPQEITGFYAVENAAVQMAKPADELPAPPEQQFRRKVVLMIDNNTIEKPPRDAAIEFVGQFLDNKYAEEQEWSVVTVGHTVETLQPFTNDKERIRSALLSARRKPVYIDERQMDREILSDPVRARLRDNAADSRYDFDSTARFQSREQTARNLQAMKNSARAIIQTCRAYSASAGKKAIVLLTGGMELNTSFNAFDNGRDRQMSDMKQEMERILNTVVREANAANFKIYVVKAGGQTARAPQHDVSNRSAGLGGTSRNPFFGAGFVRGSDLSDVDSSSLTLALQTGGQYFTARNVAESLEGIDDELSNFYSLAYKPQGAEDGQYHHIEVKVKRPGVTVRHREGYVAVSSEQRLEQALRAPLTVAKDKGDLPVALELGAPERTDDGRPSIALTATMPMSAINTVPRGDARVGRLHIYLTVYDEQGNNVGFHHQVQDLRVPATGLDAAQRFRYTTKVALKKGRYTVVITIRDDISGEIGSALQSVRL